MGMISREYEKYTTIYMVNIVNGQSKENTPGISAPSQNQNFVIIFCVFDRRARYNNNTRV